MDEFTEACATNKVTVVEKMIKEDEKIVNKKGKYGRTGLMDAVYNDNAITVSKILSTEGVDMFKKSMTGNTVFHYACEFNSFNSLRLLLVQSQSSKELVRMRNNAGDTAKMLAQRNKHAKCEKLISEFLL